MTQPVIDQRVSEGAARAESVQTPLVSGRIGGPMVGVAQSVRASGCGPEGRGFESPRSPQIIEKQGT